MAGAGFKTFGVGDVLTASDVNGYLMQQAVMNFADSGARGSAIGTATEGMVSYLQDTDSVEVYDGSAWTAVNGLVAVKHALFTGTMASSTASGGTINITDLSITHTLAEASNKVIISVYIGAAASSQQTGLVPIRAAVDGTPVGVGTSPGNRTPTTVGGPSTGSGGASGRVSAVQAFTLVYAPGDTASHTYTVQAVQNQTTTQTVYINRAEDDTDDQTFVRTSSSLVIQEVRV